MMKKVADKALIMEVWLVRHGETFSNVQKIIQGASSELTDKGKM
jgi:broad specificity phosphatase PhoE